MRLVTDWALPDQLTFATVSALLRIASAHPVHRNTCFQAVAAFVSHIVHMLQQGTCEYPWTYEKPALTDNNPASDIISQFAPCFHGFYRAIISMPFSWSVTEWTTLANHLNELFSPQAVENLNRLLVDVLRASAEDPEEVTYIQTFLSRYISRGRPLSGYFTVCCVIEAQWTILAQALIPTPSQYSLLSDDVEAAAANKAWRTLLHEAVPSSLERTASFKVTLQTTLSNSMQSFSSLLLQIEEMDAEPSEDSYAWETMSENLVR